MRNSVINEYVHVLDTVARPDHWVILYEPFDFPCEASSVRGKIRGLELDINFKGDHSGLMLRSPTLSGFPSTDGFSIHVMGRVDAEANALMISWTGKSPPEHYLCVSYEVKEATEVVDWKKYGF